MYLNEIMNTFSAAGVGNAPSANFSLIAGLVVFVLLAGGAAAFLLMRRNKQDTAAPTSPVYKLATELKGEQQKADIIVNAIEDGLVLFDEQLTIRTFNPSAARITGWSDGDASNLPLETVVKIIDTKGEPYPEKTDPFRRVFAEKATIRLNDAELLTQSGKHVAISLTISPLINEQQQVFAAVATFRDITVERAEVQRRDDFVSTASHEMRTPVAAIEGYLALALNDKVSIIDSRAREYLEKAHASTQHLGQLFQDLLTSAKAEDGRLSSHPVVVEMGSYLQQLTDDLHFAADKKGLAVEFVAGINNIINASGDGNKVIRPLYYVIDTGNGIPAEDVPHLFQKFYRVDNSATRTIGGTGLGLYISRKIVELYEGRIWVDSQLNKGTTFYINLPRLNTQEATNLQRTQTYQTVPQ
jgi:PAS domain S-box-containing protein